MTDAFSGRPFKVLSETHGTVMAEFDHLSDAQKAADILHLDDANGAHFRVIEIKWCGGSMRLSDLDARRA